MSIEQNEGSTKHPKGTKLEYGKESLYLLSETLNFYFVSKNEDGTKQYAISKMEYEAYQNTK